MNYAQMKTEELVSLLESRGITEYDGIPLSEGPEKKRQLIEKLLLQTDKKAAAAVSVKAPPKILKEPERDPWTKECLVTIFGDETPEGQLPVKLWVNGRECCVLRDKPTWIPWPHYEHLRGLRSGKYVLAREETKDREKQNVRVRKRKYQFEMTDERWKD